MTVRRWLPYLLPLLAIAVVAVGRRENALGYPLDLVLQPVFAVVGRQLTTILAAFVIGAVTHLLVTGAFGRARMPPRWYLVAVSVTIATVGTWVTWNLGECCWEYYSFPFPDFVIPFLLRLPITESTYYQYVAAYLLTITASSLVGAAIVTRFVDRRRRVLAAESDSLNSDPDHVPPSR